MNVRPSLGLGPTGWSRQPTSCARPCFLTGTAPVSCQAPLPFAAEILAKAATLTMQILNDAGFDILHAALATVTTFDYVWGYVTAEQTGEGPESEPASQRGSRGPSPFGSGMMDAFMTEIDILSSTEKFDWGLRVIVSGLESALVDSTNGTRTKP